MYKLAILDIDGTLINNKGEITAYTTEILNAVRQKGIVVTICTGRNIRKTLPVAKRAGVNTAFACIDGTLLYDSRKNCVLEGLCISMEELHYILEIASQRDLLIEVTDGYKYFKFARTEALYQYDMFNKRTFRGRIKSYMGGVRYAKNIDDLKLLKQPVYQVILAGEQEMIAGIKNSVQAHEAGRIDARDHLWKNCLFISRQGVSKSMGMNTLCRYNGCSLKETIAIGDDLNDIDMIEAAGMGIAMGNAHERVKAVADYITASNEEDGAAKALAHFLL